MSATLQRIHIWTLHVMKYTPCFMCSLMIRSLSLYLFSPLPPLGHRHPLCSLRRLSKVKVRDLEQKCRSQSEHFHQLSEELLNFRLQSDTVDVLKSNPASASQIPLSPEKKLSQVIVGFEAQPQTGGSGASARGQTPVLSNSYNNVVTYFIFSMFCNSLWLLLLLLLVVVFMVMIYYGLTVFFRGDPSVYKYWEVLLPMYNSLSWLPRELREIW